MFWITVQTPPPLKFSGLVLMRVQISASLPFQVVRAELRLSTIQFPLPIYRTSFPARGALRRRGRIVCILTISR